MKCPYREFQECVVQECPSCNYEIEKYEVTEGKFPTWMPDDEAIKQGYAWKAKKTRYIFKGCKLVDNNVQPIPKAETHIHNKTENNVAISHSIF